MDGGRTDAAPVLQFSCLTQPNPFYLRYQVTYGAVVSACAYARDMAAARRVMDEMRGAGVMPDAVEYSSMVRGCVWMEGCSWCWWDRVGDVMTDWPYGAPCFTVSHRNDNHPQNNKPENSCTGTSA